MANVNDTVDLIKARLSRFSASTGLDAYVVDEMAAAQARLESMPTMPWFGLTEVTNLSIVASTADYALPSDFLRPAGNSFKLRIINSDSEVFFPKYSDAASASTMYPPESTDEGRPVEYSIVNDSMRFWPTPNAAFTGKYWYYAKDTVPAADGSENNWLKYYSDLLCAETQYYLSLFYLRDEKTAQYWMKERDRLYSLYQRDVIAREMALLSATPED